MAERRRFNTRERVALYLAADGQCTRCGTELGPGWHGDHVDPYSRGGPTDLINGQALCPPCNLKKGSQQMAHTADQFQPRPFQREVIHSVLDGITSGRTTSVVLASPGSGKTLAYQAAATYARREGLINYLAVFVPRIVLAKQCETSWLHGCAGPDHCEHCKKKPELYDPRTRLGGYHNLFSPAGRIGPIRHAGNKIPLLPAGETGIGCVATYSALVSNPALYESWARNHAGRYLLVADEAQFCGASNDERSGGTKAGAMIAELHAYAAHTLLLTGTPYRSDDQPLILADYDAPDEAGKRRLLCHAEASYADGIAAGYLRRFEATVHDARIRWKAVNDDDGKPGTVTEYSLSAGGGYLADVLRKPEVWQPIADGVINAVREKQRVHPDYRGLISCIEQRDAKAVAAYLTSRYPDLRVKLAISEDGPEAEKVLRDFQGGGADVLVTVRKAFIGYDCPEITVVGILTHYRDKGHLMQLVGRGLRVWDGTAKRPQSCRVIAPDDPQMQEFIAFMRGESEQGLRERARRERDEGSTPGSGDEGKPGYVESAYVTTARAVSNDVEVDNDERILFESIKHDLGLVEDVTNLVKFAEVLGTRLGAGQPPPVETAPPVVRSSVPLTEMERVQQINAKVSEEIRSYLASEGVLPSDPAYQQVMARVTKHVNDRAGYKSAQVRTVEQAEARLAAAFALRERAR